MKRRTFLVWSGKASVAATCWSFIAACDEKPKPKKKPAEKVDLGAPKAAREPYTFQFWKEKEQVALTSAIDRLLPASEGGAPAGTAVGVLEYLDRQMMEPHFKDLHRMMRGGVGFLDRVAKKFHGGTFSTRTPDVQDEILRQFQGGLVPTLKFPQKRFFTTLHSFLLEGYWGHPKYGGNREKAVWAWVDINPHCSHIHSTCTE